MANVIRQDVIEVSVKADSGGLNKLNASMDKLKAGAVGAVNGGFKKLTDTFKKSKTLADQTSSAFDDVGKSTDDMNDSLDDTAKSSKKSHSSLKAFAKVSFASLGKGLNTVLTKLTQIASKAGGAALNGLKKMASVSFRAVAAGITATAVAVGSLVAKSVSAYADYEQLVGGVDTLFKGSSGTVQKYANDAYKTAGLSANSYMETVTGFSASLISSLGGDTKKAASYADMAVTDMADNANKMGTSMESITDTYKSLARGSYAMLDNLKLGKIHYCPV